MSLSVNSLFSCEGKVAVVTGGSKGIGYMISSGLVQNGATVYMFSRKPDYAVAEQLTATGPGKCYAMACDVNSKEAIERVFKEISSREECIHILVNNSGATWGDTFDNTPKHSFDKLMGVNVTGLFMCSQAFAPLLERGAKPLDPASIINIASIDGLSVPPIEEYAYSASKAAVLQLTKLMAGFLANRNINCNCISPGLFPSKMSAQIFDIVGKDAAHAAIPFNRAGTAEDIASAVLFLAGRGGAYTTGANIVIDGGVTSKPRI